MFTLSQFKQAFKVARPNNFYVEITLPPGMKNIWGDNSRLAGSAFVSNVRRNWLPIDLSSDINNTFKFRCEATEFPGKTISTSESISTGPVTKHAYETAYGDLNLTIIAAEDMRERIFFEVWMENIVNNTTLSRGYDNRGGLVKYYEDYAGNGANVKIIHYKNDNSLAASCALYEAYPIQLSGMNLTWEEQNSYQRFSVTMTYRYHIVQFSS